MALTADKYIIPDAAPGGGNQATQSATRGDADIDAVYDSNSVAALTDLAAGTALTVSTGYFVTLTAARTLTFSGTPAENGFIRLELTVTGGPHILTIPTSERRGTSGTTTAITLDTGNHTLRWSYVDGAWALYDSAPVTVTDYLSGLFATGADDDTIVLLKSPIAGTIINTTTKSVSGTATYTFKINTTALGGTANSVSSSETTQAHASANAFAVGDDIGITRSADSTCVNGGWTIEYTREV